MDAYHIMSRLADAVQEYDTAAKVVIQRFPFRSVCSPNRRDRENEWIIMSQYVFKLARSESIIWLQIINFLRKDGSFNYGKYIMTVLIITCQSE